MKRNRQWAHCLSRVATGQPVTDTAAEIRSYLSPAKLQYKPVIETDGHAIVLDLSTGSELFGEKLADTGVDRLSALIDRATAESGTAFAFGRYGEQRDLYCSDIFAGGDATDGERRDVHLGIDLFCASGTPVHAPLEGIVEIIGNNTAELDYGPMLILRHRTPSGVSFYTLYGHLALDSIKQLAAGDRIAAGERIAATGTPPENGNWPPHLHLQVIVDLLGLGADFPGVAFRSELETCLQLSPSPSVFFADCDRHLLDAIDLA